MRPGKLAGLKARLGQLLHRTDGQDLIEYGALIAIIATTVLIAITELGARVPSMYSTTAAAMPGGDPADDDPGNGNPGNGNPNPGNGNPGNGNPNPGGGNPGGGNPGGGNPGGGNPGGSNPGGGNPGGGNPGK